MDKQPGPIFRDIVLVGGGHSHVFVLKRFAMAPIDGVRLTLISPDAHTPYSGMLPGLIAGHYTYDETHIDVAALCQFAGARFYRSTVTALDLAGKHVICEGRPPVPFDLLSIDAGSTPDPSGTPAAKGRVIPVKPVPEFLAAWAAIKADVASHPDRTISIVGSGAGGVELALATQFAINRDLGRQGITARPRFQLVTGSPQILQTHNAKVRAIFELVLEARGIERHTNVFVDRVSDEGLHGNGHTFASDHILWATGADAAPWIRESGLATDERGFMKIDQHLRSVSHLDVFGAGDIATIAGHTRPKSGVFAVRQGPPLADNLRWAVRGRALGTHRPQTLFMSLISTGDKYAVGSWGNLAIEGNWVWTWKDWIDRRFMTAFNELPDMQKDEERPRDTAIGTDAERAALGDLSMRCGGCGAKVGAGILSRARSRLPRVPKAGLLIGLDVPDDAAVFTVPDGKALVQTVDQFRAMIDDPYVFGRITANHCLGDIYAMGAEPHTALALATLPLAAPAKIEQTLSDLMAGANSIFAETGCAIIGGHTGEGTELSFGFAINGLIDANNIARKSGLAAGDVLILTKPLGTGILFAAAMRRKAKGRWLDAVLTSATQSSCRAAEILRAHGTHAMTDVTGFGLAGHLGEMIAGRDVPSAPAIEVTLDLDALPVLEGAIEMAEAGIVSTLDISNRDAGNAIRNLNRYTAEPRLPLVFDPQTAGGLVAGVPQDKADACVAALRDAGYEHAAIIGHVAKGSDPTRPVILRGTSTP